MCPLTGVLAEAWDLYRRFAGHFLLISFVIYVVTAALVALLSLAGIAGAIIGAIISFAATYVVQASLIKAVQDVRDGRADLDLSQTVRAAGPFILPVIGPRSWPASASRSASSCSSCPASSCSRSGA
jgi:hypothetical protein